VVFGLNGKSQVLAIGLVKAGEFKVDILSIDENNGSSELFI